MDQAFNATKAALAAAAKLELPQADFPISAMVNASNTPCRGCPATLPPLILGPALLLLQEAEAGREPLQRLRQGVVGRLPAIRHFHLMLEDTEFFVLIDHKPLYHAFCRLSAPWYARHSSTWPISLSPCRLLPDEQVLLCSTSTGVDCPLLPF